MSQLPKMPEKRITVDGKGLLFKLDMDSKRFSSGFMRFTFEDTTANVTNENDKQIGSVWCDWLWHSDRYSRS